MTRRSGLESILVAVALVAYWWMATSVSPQIGATADEPMHLTGGVSYWRFNDYRMQPENGTLAMRWATLPIVASRAVFPPRTLPFWQNSISSRVAHAFMFEQGNSPPNLLLLGRMMIALVGVGVVWMIYRWARALWGRTAGYTALGLAVFSPTLLAHGGLVTSDMMLATCLLAAMTAYWRLLHRVTWWNLAAAGAFSGATFLAKMSGVLVVPMMLSLLAIRCLSEADLPVTLRQPRRLRGRRGIIGATLAATIAVGLMSWAIVWAGYGFRYSVFSPNDPGQLHFSWDVVLEKEPVPWSDENSSIVAPTRRPLQPTFVTRAIEMGRDYKILPEAFLWGFAHTYRFSRTRPAFFMGQNGDGGWKLFFPAAVLFKSTPATLVLFFLGVVGVFYSAKRCRRERKWFYRAAPLLVLFIIYWVVAIQTRLNIGHRHVLPTYPVIFILAGASVLWLRVASARWLRLALPAILLIHATESLSARPFYLSYFQPLVGGTAAGHKYFVDSSFDWGQGMPAFEQWLRRKAQRNDDLPVFLSYFGVDSPRARGLTVTRVADEFSDHGPRAFPARLTAGWYALSATYFRGVYLGLPGPWNDDREALYRKVGQRLESRASSGMKHGEAHQAQLLRDAMDWEALQFARLCHHLRKRDPIEIVGGSLLIYYLSDAELNEALHGDYR